MVKEIFESKSFAVVGASRYTHKVGHIVFKNLISKRIESYPINPNAKKILGRTCYNKLMDLRKKVDCAVLAVNAKIVPMILNDAGKKGIKNVIIISSGFSEAGNHELDSRIKKIAEKYKINILGPNTIGFINPYTQVNPTFFGGMPEKGKIAFLSQSGAIGVAVLDKAIKLSGFVSLGNSLDLDFSDFIDYFSEDKKTKIITAYMESLDKGRGMRFIDSCRDSKKPIVVLKAGKTSLGFKAASSHTAALASEEGVYEGIFKQCNIIEVNSIKELFQLADLYVKTGKPGKRAAVITNAGGLGVLCSDYCMQKNIALPKIPEKVKKKLNRFLPSGWSKNNPIDILGDARADRYDKTIKLIEKEDFFDFMLIMLTPQNMTEPLKVAKNLMKLRTRKPIIVCFMGGKKVEKSRKLLEKSFPVFTEIEEAIEVLGKLQD
jgi:acetyltransferase